MSPWCGVQIMVCEIILLMSAQFSLPLAVQGQVPRYCTLPKGPLSPPKQPGCYDRRDTGCFVALQFHCRRVIGANNNKTSILKIAL